MNNSLRKNPFFYATIVLAGVLMFELAGIVVAQYMPPTVPPPGGMPAAPLNAGTVPQVKRGNFAVSATGVFDANGNVSTGVQINAASPTVWFRDAGGQARLYYVSANGGELWVQHGTSGGIKVGTGTGGGTNYWTPSGSGIYTNYNVGVGISNPEARLDVSGEFRVSIPTVTSELAWVRTQSDLAVLPSGVTTAMNCDVGRSARDCEDDVRATNPPSVSRTAGCGSTTCGSTGNRRYDQFTVTVPDDGGPAFVPFMNVAYAREDTHYDVYTLQTVQAPTGANTPIFRVDASGNVTIGGPVTDINLTAPRWSGTTGDVPVAEGGTRKDFGAFWVDTWATCPDGHFVSAVRFGERDGTNLHPVVRCSKL